MKDREMAVCGPSVSASLLLSNSMKNHPPTCIDSPVNKWGCQAPQDEANGCYKAGKFTSCLKKHQWRRSEGRQRRSRRSRKSFTAALMNKLGQHRETLHIMNTWISQQLKKRTCTCGNITICSSWVHDFYFEGPCCRSDSEAWGVRTSQDPVVDECFQLLSKCFPLILCVLSHLHVCYSAAVLSPQGHRSSRLCLCTKKTKKQTVQSSRCK